MPKILVNYTYNKKTDTYALMDSSIVYADMPIAVMDMGSCYDDILVVPINGQNTVVDKAEYMAIHKQFELEVVDSEGHVAETQNGAPVWLPKNTDISKLRFINGQLVMVSDENEEGE